MIEISLACIRALAYVPIQTIEDFLCSPDHPRHPVVSIKPLLSSNIPNEQYVFLSALLALPVELWSGASEKILAQLSEAEVRRIMSFLASNDSTIRAMVSGSFITILSSCRGRVLIHLLPHTDNSTHLPNGSSDSGSLPYTIYRQYPECHPAHTCHVRALRWPCVGGLTAARYRRSGVCLSHSEVACRRSEP